MPKVTLHVNQGRSKKAQQCARCVRTINKGEKYFMWGLKSGRGGIVYRQHESCGRPRASQLTLGRLAGVYAAVETAEDAVKAAGDCSDVKQALDECHGEIDSLKDEFQDSFDNMPEGLQQGDTGQLLERRIEQLDEFLTELENAANDIEEDEDLEVDDEDPKVGEARDKAQEALDSLDIE
jgi:hypothetical protein